MHLDPAAFTAMVGYSAVILISIPLFTSSIPYHPYFRGIPDEDGQMDPSVAEKWEEFRVNLTDTSKQKSLLSCLEDQTYSAINDFANCHLFCPLCNQGYGRCESTGDMRLCICDCDFFGLGEIFMPSGECPWVHKLCTRAAESAEQAYKLERCQNECQERGFIDAALCGAEMEDPPLVRSTCTCLC